MSSINYTPAELAKMSDKELDRLPYEVAIKELDRRAGFVDKSNYRRNLIERLGAINSELDAFYEVLKADTSMENINKWNNLQASKYIIESKINKIK